MVSDSYALFLSQQGSSLPVEVMMVDGLYGRKEQEGLLKCLQGMELVSGNYISTSFSVTFLILLLMCFTFSIVVNCIQSHPFDCAVATSGIDNTIKVYNLCFH